MVWLLRLLHTSFVLSAFCLLSSTFILPFLPLLSLHGYFAFSVVYPSRSKRNTPSQKKPLLALLFISRFHVPSFIHYVQSLFLAPCFVHPFFWFEHFASPFIAVLFHHTFIASFHSWETMSQRYTSSSCFLTMQMLSVPLSVYAYNTKTQQLSPFFWFAFGSKRTLSHFFSISLIAKLHTTWRFPLPRGRLYLLPLEEFDFFGEREKLRGVTDGELY